MGLAGSNGIFIYMPSKYQGDLSMPHLSYHWYDPKWLPLVIKMAQINMQTFSHQKKTLQHNLVFI